MNPKWKKSWVNPVQLSTSTAKADRFGKKTMLCVYGETRKVWCTNELLKPGETVNAAFATDKK